MKEELQTKLVEILTSIQAATGKASDFAMSQLPDIAQSYVLYGRISSLAYLVLAVLMLLGVAWAVRRTYQGVIGDGWDGAVWLPVGLGGAAVGAIAMVIGAGAIRDGLLVWLAPKVWLLKELAGLVK